ncbi:Crp/Fnr family transcriptional regulator, partial [Pseudacidovorax intermedius]|uniref:Crp/Fnr family transcriptional regulator n=1 Tax=Pseudacidovorax intermedius TaxID=433924 RepID=UPI0007344CB2
MSGQRVGVGSGLLRVVVPGPNDAAVTTSFLSPDDMHLGAPLTGPRQPSDLSLVAALPSSVYVMPLWTLHRLCDHYPEVPQMLLQTQLRQMTALRKQIRRRHMLTAERLVGRVLQELTTLAPEGEHAFDRRISQGVIASYAGLSRPMVNKVLRDLEERGLVQRDGDAVHVQDDPAFDSDFHAPLAPDGEGDADADGDG